MVSLQSNRDHPRIRGEHDIGLLALDLVSGSSPHTRGAQRYAQSTYSLDRIIPAYAGSTASMPATASARRDHPRIRGEHAVATELARHLTGSSPHTRGARCARQPGSYRWRIIPAYAGSTPCGRPVRAGLLGSSPHTRGAPSRWCSRSLPRGIIPAYAGSTSGVKSASSLSSDHPRIRGEHLTQARQAKSMSGSSPHTRGAQPRQAHRPPVPGVIPAYAGSTVGGSGCHRAKRDHPRIRGEHYEVGVGGRECVGSSPHTRGARDAPAPEGAFDGIIPAYAGSTRRRRAPSGRHEDHPRIRGEHDHALLLPRGRRGSSPHTRGAP